jgi:hypothetical protein
MPRAHQSPHERGVWGRVLQARSDLFTARSNTEALIERTRQVEEALAVCVEEIRGLRGQLAAVEESNHTRHDHLLLAMRIVRDQDAAARQMLSQVRATAQYEMAFDEDEPLVSVVIPTYLEWRLLRERALPSILAQTYERWEAIVVGDAAPDETRAAVESFGDQRIRFVNLPYRGPYPEDPKTAWLVSGTKPWNTGASLAAGRWIGQTGDDDALRPSYIESLLNCARREHAEVPYGFLRDRNPNPADDVNIGRFPPEHGHWGMQGALFHEGLRFLALEPSDWVFGVPNDWSLAERMLRIGVRFAMIEEPVVDYYSSRVWKDGAVPRAALDALDTA